MIFRRFKFDFNAEKHLENNCIENGKAVIAIKVNDKESFYNELDAKRVTLSSDITSFIDNKIYYIPYKYSTVIKFYCERMSTDEEQAISEMLRSWYGMKANQMNKELRTNNYKSLTLFIIGICFLGLSSFLTNFGFLIEQVLSIAGWVAIWETVSSVLFDTVRLKLDRYDAVNLYNAEVLFIYDKRGEL